MTFPTNPNVDIFWHLQKPGNPSGLKKNGTSEVLPYLTFFKSVLNVCGPSFPSSNTLPVLGPKVLVLMQNTKLFNYNFHFELAKSYPPNPEVLIPQFLSELAHCSGDGVFFTGLLPFCVLAVRGMHGEKRCVTELD